MVLDHTVFALSLAEVPWHMPGRVVFPIFAFLIAYNLLQNSKNKMAYILRLFAFAVVSQVPSMWLFDREYYALNIFATLLVGALFILGVQSISHLKRYLRVPLVLFFLLMACAVSLFYEYSFFGVLAIAAFYYVLTAQWSVFSVSLLLMAILFLNLSWHPALAVVAVASIPLIYFTKYLIIALPRMPKLFAYAFYPVHLLIIEFIFGS